MIGLTKSSKGFRAPGAALNKNAIGCGGKAAGGREPMPVNQLAGPGVWAEGPGLRRLADNQSIISYAYFFFVSNAGNMIIFNCKLGLTVKAGFGASFAIQNSLVKF